MKNIDWINLRRKIDRIICEIQANGGYVYLENDQLGDVYSLAVFAYKHKKILFHKENLYARELVWDQKFELPKDSEKLQKSLKEAKKLVLEKKHD